MARRAAPRAINCCLNLHREKLRVDSCGGQQRRFTQPNRIDPVCYLHCDSTASHYLKLLMDAVFGAANFRNDISWKRFNFHADARRFGRVADNLLFYSKSDSYNFNQQRVPFSREYVESKFTHRDSDGRRFRLSDLNPPSGRGPIYEFNGVTRPWRFAEEKMRELDECVAVLFKMIPARSRNDQPRTSSETTFNFGDYSRG